MSRTSNTSKLAEASATNSARSSAPIPRLVRALLVAVALAFSSSVMSTDAVFAATVPLVNQCNGVTNVDGVSIACDVTLINNLDLATGLTSSVLTTRECHGVAGDVGLCTNTVTSFTQLGTSVTQCNDSGNGGGGNMTCNVSVVNNITGDGSVAPATINQCIGSGGGGGSETTCVPVQNTTTATVTQCNGSGNGGGSLIACSVLPSTETASLGVTVNQCNGSENGGGSTVTCTASITNNFLAAPPTIPTVPATTTPPEVTAPGATTPGATTPVTTPVVTTPLFGTVPPVTLPVTGSGSEITGMATTAALVLFVGGLTIAISRRRRPTSR